MHKRNTKHATPSPSKPTGARTATSATVPSGDKNNKTSLVSAEDIRLCAYRKWESAGKPNGDGVQFWLEAEYELVHRET